jgi:Uma2 family endonuclease
MGDAARRRATYADVLAAPPGKIAQVVNGELHVQPRPAGPHASVSSILGEELGHPFRRGRGGPGGWILLDEPELHLDEDILVPDLAGWRRERLPRVPRAPYFTLASDWVCEVLSPSTAKLDRAEKLAIYAREGVGHAWLVDPLERTLEVFRRQGAEWLLLGVHRDDDVVRAEPFDAIELELASLWADIADE